jgi:YggT family protein
MLNNAVLFLVQTLLGLLTLAFLLRFYFQLTKVSFQNQAAQLIVSVTNFAVKPVRRFLPSIAKIDVSTLLLAFITQLLLALISLWLKGFPLLIAGASIWPSLLGLAGLDIISMSITLFLYAVLIQAVLSWINPHTAIAPILNSLTYPLLSFLRRFIPTAGNIDLSSLVFIILAQLVLTTILLPLEQSLLFMR